MPSIRAPSATRKLAEVLHVRLAGGVGSIVAPSASAAAIRTFSVAVTLGSSRKSRRRGASGAERDSAPRRRCSRRAPAPEMRVERAAARSRRRPAAAAPRAVARQHAGRQAGWRRGSARTGPGRGGGSQIACVDRELVRQPVACAPTDRSRSSSVRRPGCAARCESVTGSSVRSVAARIGSAAFLLPLGSMLPERR